MKLSTEEIETLVLSVTDRIERYRDLRREAEQVECLQCRQIEISRTSRQLAEAERLSNRLCEKLRKRINKNTIWEDIST